MSSIQINVEVNNNIILNISKTNEIVIDLSHLSLILNFWVLPSSKIWAGISIPALLLTKRNSRFWSHLQYQVSATCLKHWKRPHWSPCHCSIHSSLIGRHRVNKCSSSGHISCSFPSAVCSLNTWKHLKQIHIYLTLKKKNQQKKGK